MANEMNGKMNKCDCGGMKQASSPMCYACNAKRKNRMPALRISSFDPDAYEAPYCDYYNAAYDDGDCECSG